MERPERSPELPCRRVGTFTFGLVLMSLGAVMLLSMFAPALDLRWVLKLSPLALISLGTEVLLSARGNSRLRYDWAGLLLCALTLCAVLPLFFCAWYLMYGPALPF